ADDDGDKGNLLDRIIDIVPGLFQPFLGALAASYILKVVAALLASTVVDTTSSSYIFMNTIVACLLQYLLRFLAVSDSKKFSMNTYTAVAIACALVYPGLAESLTEATNIFGLNFTLPAGGYYNTVLPILLAIFVASMIEKFMKKVTPDVLKLFAVPMV